MILDPEQTGRLREVIAEGEYYGMQTFDQALLRHHQAGRVSMEDALRVASSPHEFKLLVAADGRTSTSMEDLAGDGRSAPTRPITIRPPEPGVAADAPSPVAPSPVGPSRNASAPPPGVPA